MTSQSDPPDFLMFTAWAALEGAADRVEVVSNGLGYHEADVFKGELLLATIQTGRVELDLFTKILKAVLKCTVTIVGVAPSA